MASTLRTAATAASLALAAMAPLGTHAANLVQNGTFDQNVNSWLNSILWDGIRDAANNPASGSGQVSATGQCFENTQCVPVTSGTAYDFSAQILIPSGALTTATGLAQGGVIWRDQVCGQFPATLIGSDGATPVTNTDGLDTWHGVSLVAKAAPAGAKSAYVKLLAYPQTAGQFTANFDNVTLAAVASVPVAATAVPSLSGETLSLLALLVGTLGGRRWRWKHIA